MKKLVNILFFIPVIAGAQCVKDTSEAYITAKNCDSCSERLRIGYVVYDKCLVSPGQYTFENPVFLNIRKQPIAPTVIVVKYRRKNDNE